jgi:hypothetical protein
MERPGLGFYYDKFLRGTSGHMPARISCIIRSFIEKHPGIRQSPDPASSSLQYKKPPYKEGAFEIFISPDLLFRSGSRTKHRVYDHE